MCGINRLFLEFKKRSVPVGGPELKAQCSISGIQEEALKKPRELTMLFLRFPRCLRLSAFIFIDFSTSFACLLCYIYSVFVVRGQKWEEWSYYILAELEILWSSGWSSHHDLVVVFHVFSNVDIFLLMGLGTDILIYAEIISVQI